MHGVIYDTQRNLTVTANTETTVTAPAFATGFYISSNQLIRLTLDGSSANNTNGLAVPLDASAIFSCSELKPIKIWSLVEAKVSIQFLRGQKISY